MPDDVQIHTAAPARAVEDLRWVVASPPLVSGRLDGCRWTGRAYHEAAARRFAPRLESLAADPTPLLEHLDDQRDRRLGAWFEALFGYWLRSCDRYELLECNRPIRHPREGHTLGALDFLLRDRRSGVGIHWEVACKFYLLDGASERAHDWIGPGRRDRLGDKLDHMRRHQTRLGLLPAFRPLLERHGLVHCRRRATVKGRLFWPVGEATGALPEGVCSTHLSGVWGTVRALRAHFDPSEACWQTLSRWAWLAPLETNAEPLLALDEVIARWHRGDRWPLALARLHEGREQARVFLVDDDWASRAPAAGTEAPLL